MGIKSQDVLIVVPLVSETLESYGTTVVVMNVQMEKLMHRDCIICQSQVRINNC